MADFPIKNTSWIYECYKWYWLCSFYEINWKWYVKKTL